MNFGPQQMLTATEVAAMFRVDPTTVVKWAREGKLPAVLTPGGRRRYRAADVLRLLTDATTGSCPMVDEGEQQ